MHFSAQNVSKQVYMAIIHPKKLLLAIGFRVFVGHGGKIHLASRKILLVMRKILQVMRKIQSAMRKI